MITGLEGVIDGLESTTTPEQAFEHLERLKKVVGPPIIVLPSIDLTCTTDSDCALTDLRIVDDAYRCCSSLLYSAGTVRWTRDLDRTCRTYEPFRGSGAFQLPACGVATGPISANVAWCKSGRCVACLEPNDGSAPYCHP